MSKTDFKQTLKHLYNPSRKEFSIVEVPAMNFLMIDGHGDPNTAQAYQDAVEALYAVAYGLKFMSKKETGKDYVVPPLEGLWWVETKGYQLAGKHHEIYLGDPRKVAPEKLKTVLRQPVREA